MVCVDGLLRKMHGAFSNSWTYLLDVFYWKTIVGTFSKCPYFMMPSTRIENNTAALHNAQHC
jgi:hypothetical protein